AIRSSGCSTGWASSSSGSWGWVEAREQAKARIEYVENLERRRVMAQTVDHQQIIGVARPVTDLFSPARQYTVEYYQREYAWTTSNVEEMVNDLVRSFLSSYSETDARETVASYSPYFLGPIVTYSASAKSYLVDGQQRLTTLSLLLMYLRERSEDEYQKSALQNLVFSAQFGKEVFRINVEDRTAVMQAILRGDANRPDGLDSSSANIWDRYEDIVRVFPEELAGARLPYFVDWLQNRVVLVEISTPDANMALEIFESMNDRGLHLTNMDMLKSFILSRIQVPERIERANVIWRDTVDELVKFQKNLDADFMKTLLRAKYAQTARETGKGTIPKDFENIGTAFHKWVREQVDSPDSGVEVEKSMRLAMPGDFEVFVEDMRVHAQRYLTLMTVSRKLTPGWEHVYFNAVNGFTLQYLLAIAASEVTDSDETFKSKVQLITRYVDIVVARRMVNSKRRGTNAMYRRIFALAKTLRGLSLDETRQLLAGEVVDLEESMDGVLGLALNSTNKADVYYLLARMTSWLEGEETDRYFKGGSHSEPFEVEHVWADKFERHRDEFTSEIEFRQSRALFGALLLLPKSFNASYGALPYSDKVKHYANQNALAQTLAQGVGTHNPNLRRKADQLKVPVIGYPETFKKSHIEERQGLYEAICEIVWDPKSLGLG
ncbi:MAG: DUF262 domain-containing protein, partial [Microbacteriaceae bacterium]|nr:DUF262 domain-containing protein [Microbacteriaceae bacterium]